MTPQGLLKSSRTAATIRHAMVVVCLFGFGMTPASAQDQDEPFQLVCTDGFVLDGMVRAPESDTGPKKVVILLHGSGPQSMDADLTAVTLDRQPNLLFREISDALADSGFTVIRYNKRSYQIGLAYREDQSILETDQYKGFEANPLKYFVNDAIDAVRYAEERYPDAEIYLLGHSQGTYVALQAADQLPQVMGVALVGFYVTTTDLLVHEQTVYRPRPLFDALDSNRDEQLDPAELAVETPVAASLRSQLRVLDLDADSSIALHEFQAGNLSNILMSNPLEAMRKQEAQYPRPTDILAEADFTVAFFQGMWDNQTPAYHTKALELVARFVWNKEFNYFYFPGLGHALDPRDSYGDLTYRLISEEAKAKLVSELSRLF